MVVFDIWWHLNMQHFIMNRVTCNFSFLELSNSANKQLKCLILFNLCYLISFILKKEIKIALLEIDGNETVAEPAKYRGDSSAALFTKRKREEKWTKTVQNIG